MPVKGKKLYHLVIQLISVEESKSNLKEFDSETSITDGKTKAYQSCKSTKSIKSIQKIPETDRRLEDIYAEILEQSMNEDNASEQNNTVKYNI